MKQIYLFFVFGMGLFLLGAGQNTSRGIQLYHPEADAQAQIETAVTQAQQEGKHVLLQIGGNWCSWCIRFHQYVQADPSLKDLLFDNFVVEKINVSRENQNEAVLASLGFPQRFGFPVFVILDGNGRRIHTQDSGYLEKGDSYDSLKVASFFRNWSKRALEAESYSK